MAYILEELQKYRFLLVVGGVIVGLALGRSFWPNAPLDLPRFPEVVAGTSEAVVATGEPKETLTLVVTSPTGENIRWSTETDAQGKAKISLPGEKLTLAGDYTLNIHYGNRKTLAAEQSFKVVPGSASEKTSRVNFSQNVLKEGQTLQMAILLLDEYKNPIEGHELSVSASEPSVQVYTSEFSSNEKGQIRFSISGSGNGIVSFSIFDITEGISILGNPQLAVGNADPIVTLATTGTVENFIVSGLSSQTLASEQQSITVKAIDSEGETVKNYTGTIRFSSSDDEADLPKDYTFLAEDQGKHTFSLSVKLITPGDQTLTATDIDDTSVKGSAKTEVVLSMDGNSNDYNSDFETSDFNRTGDFTLISPASGSQSTSNVEVQGEGEYGNSAVIFVEGEEAGRTDIAFDNSFSYTIEDMSDGEYDIYVEIVNNNDEVLEQSDVETVTIDTTPPELVEVSSDPDKNIQTKATVTLTVLSEKDLEAASIIFQDQVVSMEETPTPGKYQTELVMPTQSGDYPVDVVLEDSLGNEAQYRDAFSLSVGTGASEVSPSNTDSEWGEVTGLTASAGAAQATLTWETPSSANTIAYYRIYYGPSPEALYAVSETFDSSTHWTIPELVAGQKYYFSVSAVDVEGNEGPQSGTVMAIPTTGISTPGGENTYVPEQNPPLISGMENEIPQNPESGPSERLIFGLSALAGLTYILLRKRAHV